MSGRIRLDPEDIPRVLEAKLPGGRSVVDALRRGVGPSDIDWRAQVIRALNLETEV